MCKDNYYEICDYWDEKNLTRTKLDEEELKNSKIVLCVGDSFTFGDGVYYKDTWPALLQDKDFFKDYKVINIGIRGASNDLITKLLRNWCNRYSTQIEYVIIGFSYINRRMHYVDADYDGTFQPLPSIVNVHPSQANEKNLHTTTRRLYSRYLELSNDGNDLENSDRNLLITKGLGRIHNFKTYFFFMELCMVPGNEIYKKDSAIGDLITKNFDEFLSDDFQEMNLYSQELNCLEYKIGPDDGHWNSKGHNKIASAIDKYMSHGK